MIQGKWGGGSDLVRTTHLTTGFRTSGVGYLSRLRQSRGPCTSGYLGVGWVAAVDGDSKADQLARCQKGLAHSVKRGW